MFFYLSKLIDFLIEPLIWVIVLLALSIVLKKKRKKLVIWSIALLYLFSNEFLFQEVSRLYEYPILDESKLKEKYEGVIILGGLSHFNRYNGQLHFNGSADRMLKVLPYYFDGRIEKIIIAGGSGRLTQDDKESPLLKEYLIQIGVKEKDIYIEDQSRNTFENAKYSNELIEKEQMEGPFLLSTSASHMRRSIACFEKIGLNVEAFPVDYLSNEREFNPDRLFRPKTSVLKSWNALIHEWLGYISYKIAGYC